MADDMRKRVRPVLGLPAHPALFSVGAARALRVELELKALRRAPTAYLGLIAGRRPFGASLPRSEGLGVVGGWFEGHRLYGCGRIPSRLDRKSSCPDRN